MQPKIQSSFEPEELDYLTKNFHLTTNESLDRRHSIQSIDLLDQEKCVVYLDWLTGILNSPSRMITASQFSKRYAFLTIAPCLYAMTVYNKAFDLSVEHCHVDSEYHGESWLASICITDLHVTEPTTRKRCEWRDQIFKKIFADNLAKIWRSLSKAANIPMSILWENTAIRVFSLYEKRIGEWGSGTEVRGDFEYLISKAPATLFGETKNPLEKFYGSKCTISSSNQPVRIRKTCCFYYKVSSKGAYCSTCPKVKH